MSAGRRLLVTLALMLAAGVVPAARLAADPLDDLKARREIERQRLEEEIRKGRLEAERLARDGKRTDAILILSDLIEAAQIGEGLTVTRRNQLVATLQAEVRRLRTLPADRRPPASPLPRIIGDDFRRGEDEKGIKGAKERIGGIGGILDKRGKALSQGREIRVRGGEWMLRIRSDVLASAIPDGRDIVFPRDWAERMRKRSPAQPLTPEEKHTLDALTKVQSIDVTDATFESVLDYLKEKTGVTITVDRNALMEVGASYESRISLKLKATTRTILKRALGDLGLSYTIKSGTIHVTSIARAREEVTTRTYYVGDVAGVPDFRLPPFLNQLIMLENLQRLIVMITQTIEPQSWQVNNPEARGRITFNPITMQLVITQSAEVHYALAGRR